MGKGKSCESDVTAFAAQDELLINSVKFERLCVFFQRQSDAAIKDKVSHQLIIINNRLLR